MSKRPLSQMEKMKGLFRHGLESVSEPHALMGVSSPFIGGACRIPANHLSALPPCQPHQVVLLSSSSQPSVGEGIPELVKMEIVESR